MVPVNRERANAEEDHRAAREAAAAIEPDDGREEDREQPPGIGGDAVGRAGEWANASRDAR